MALNDSNFSCLLKDTTSRIFDKWNTSVILSTIAGLNILNRMTITLKIL